MKRMVKSSRMFKALLLAGLLAAPNLAFKAMAVPEADYHWSPLNINLDGTAYFGDPGNWDSGLVPTLTNSAGSYLRIMVNQTAGGHNPCVITNSVDLYQLMIGTGSGGGAGGI